MEHKKPEHLNSISKLLQQFGLKDHQKLEDFHILKLEDHREEMSEEFHGTTEGFYEISISCNQSIDIGINGKTYKSFDKHLSFIPAGKEIHIQKHQASDNNLGFLIFYTQKFLRITPSHYSLIKRFPYYNIHHMPVYGLDEKHYLFYNSYMEKIYQEFQNINKDSIELIRAYLTILLFETKKLLQLNELQDVKRSRAEEITFLFEQLVKDTLHKKQKLSYYASKLCISDVYLSECIKKVTGSSAKQLLTDYIIYEAKYLLTESESKLDVIATQLGFNETSNFINFFKKNSGYTPNQFRQKLR